MDEKELAKQIDCLISDVSSRAIKTINNTAIFAKNNYGEEAEKELKDFVEVPKKLKEASDVLIKLIEEQTCMKPLVLSMLTMMCVCLAGCRDPNRFIEDVEKIKLVVLSTTNSSQNNAINCINGRSEELIKEFGG